MADTQSTHMNTESPQEICFFPLCFPDSLFFSRGSFSSGKPQRWQLSHLHSARAQFEVTKISVPQGKAPV